METEIQLPDGKVVTLVHEGELTDDAIRNAVSQMGYEIPNPEEKKGSTLRELLGEGTRIGGAITGAIKGSSKGPYGAAIGGLLGAALAEPVASKITPREETTGENIANIALAGIVPEAKAANLLTRLGRGAALGAGLGGAHKEIETLVNEQRLATPSEMLPGMGAGAVMGSALEGVIGPRPVKALQELAPKPPVATAQDKMPITSSLDKKAPPTLAESNAQANQIALGKDTTVESKQVTPQPVVAEQPKRVSVEDEDAIDAAAAAQAEQPAAKVKVVASDVEKDRALYDKYQAQLGKLGPSKVSTKKYQKIWQASEDIKNKYEGMPPGEVAGGEPEKIASAAVKYSDGEIRTGKNHAEIINSNPEGDLRGSDDGFVTSTGRYVGREEGMKIAKQAGQVTPGIEREGLAIEMMTDRPFEPGPVRNKASKPAIKAASAPEATETPVSPEKPVKAAKTPKNAIPEAPPPPKPPAEAPPAAPAPGEEPDLKFRRGVKTTISDPQKAEEYKKLLKENPESKYEAEKMSAWADEADASTEQELRRKIAETENQSEKAIYLETLSNRLYAAGKHDEAQRLFIESTKIGTVAGKAMRAMGIVRSPYKDLAEAEEVALKGSRYLTKLQKEKVLQLSSKLIEAQKAVNEAELGAKKLYTKESAMELGKVRSLRDEAKLALEEYQAEVAPRNLPDMIVKIIQGNLLTPLSLTANIFGNMFWAPIERSSVALSSALDAMSTLSIKGLAKGMGVGPKGIASVRRSINATNPLPSTIELAAMADGVRVAAKELLTGPSVESYAKSEVQRGFRPLRSLMDAIAGTNLPTDEAGKVLTGDRVKAFIEGTLGVPPEIMFRMLSLGDKPFRRAAEARAYLEQARLQGVDEKDLERFMLLPDDVTAKFVKNAVNRAVFTEENRGITTLNRFLDSDLAKLIRVDKIPALAGAVKVFGRLTVPFRQFPVNYALTALNFAAPPLAMAKAAYYTGQSAKSLIDKNTVPQYAARQALDLRRKAMINMGEGVIGMMIYGVASVLWEKGLISESAADTSAKRSDQMERMGAAKLNVDGIDRMMKGEDPTYRKGDKLVEWTRAGIPAVIFHIYTQQKAKERDTRGQTGMKEDKSVKTAGEHFKELGSQTLAAAPGLGSFIFDQSFLAGTSSLMEAIKDPDPDSPKFQNWMQNMFKAITAIPVPNTTEAVARTQSQFIPEMRGRDITETLGNIWKYKTFSLPADERELVLKRDTWGRPIPRTPEGANPYVYGLIDVTKMGHQKADPHDQALYDLYTQTENPKVYPDPVGRSITFRDVTKDLDPKDVESLQETIGTLRRQRMEQFVGSRMYGRLTPDQRALALENIYESANRDGRSKFIASNGIHQKYFSPDSTVKPTSRSTKSVLTEQELLRHRQ